VDGDTAAHLRRVLRAETGQKYELSDGERLYLAEVAGFSPGSVEFRILAELPARREGARIILYASLVKFDRFEWIIEKATELGVSRLVPVASARSETGLEKAALKRWARWSRISQESGMQCRRVRPMTVDSPLGYSEAIRNKHSLRLMLDEDGGSALLHCLGNESGEIAVLTGPEGGWTTEERAEALGGGWTPVTLGEQLLRAETAAMAALSLIQGRWWAQATEPAATENRP